MIILLHGLGSWIMKATTSHAHPGSNNASIKAFCYAAQRELQQIDALLLMMPQGSENRNDWTSLGYCGLIGAGQTTNRRHWI